MQRSLLKAILITQAVTFLFVFILVTITLAIVSIFAYQKIQVFSELSGVSKQELFSYAQILYSEMNADSQTTAQPITLLILGVDEVAQRSQPILTDTILLTSINPQTAQISLLSLPRDLWSDTHKTKINALYQYGLSQSDSSFVQSAFEDLSDIQIDYVVPVQLAQLAELVDTIGGLPITVPNSFEDTQFPRPGIDPSIETDPKVLQMTVKFEAGEQIMTGEQVLQYVRSRKAEGDEGTDLARSRRQQEVVLALANALQSTELLTDLDTVAAIVKWYKTSFEQVIPIRTLVTIAAPMIVQGLTPTFQLHVPSVSDVGTKNGILLHPSPRLYGNQWVFIATDSAIFQSYIKESLYNTK